MAKSVVRQLSAQAKRQSRYNLRPSKDLNDVLLEQTRYNFRSGVRKARELRIERRNLRTQKKSKRKTSAIKTKPAVFEKSGHMGISFSKVLEKPNRSSALRKLAVPPWKLSGRKKKDPNTGEGGIRNVSSKSKTGYSNYFGGWKRRKQSDVPTSTVSKMTSGSTDNCFILSKLEALQIDQSESIIECLACMDEIPKENALCAPCKNHHYCKGCLRIMYQLAIKEEAEYPPSCCDLKFSKDIAEIALTSEELHIYNAAVREYETPMDHRIYCPTYDCKRFIAGTDTDGSGTGKDRCKHCNTEVCTYCKKPLHDGNCPEDAGVKSLLTLAKQEHWKQCQKCSAIVMKVDGCTWMRCLCKNQFCYACGFIFQKTGDCGCSKRTWAAEAHLEDIIAANDEHADIGAPVEE